MGLNFKRLYDMQKKLDQRIETEHDLIGQDLFDKKMLALQVEVAELANETRCFKFWSLKPPSEHEVIKEEYVDGLHFLLSVGILLDAYINEVSADPLEVSLTDQFHNVFNVIGNLQKTRSFTNYKELFAEFLKLGKMLNITESDIETAYISKNEVNHQRQEQGY
jgi:dimeric dUTPase (all-alpha-NTP-PPase superfamily)